MFLVVVAICTECLSYEYQKILMQEVNSEDSEVNAIATSVVFSRNLLGTLRHLYSSQVNVLVIAR